MVASHLQESFAGPDLHPKMRWHCPPARWSVRPSDRVLRIEPDAKTDFWRKTHYGFEVDNGAYFPIVGVVMGGIEDLVKACQMLWEHDIVITPAMYPAVPLDRNLVRFSITAVNTDAEVEQAIAALQAVRESLGRIGNGARLKAEETLV